MPNSRETLISDEMIQNLLFQKEYAILLKEVNLPHEKRQIVLTLGIRFQESQLLGKTSKKHMHSVAQSQI